MIKYITILGSIDRRIIFLLIGLAVLVPIMIPDWFEIPLRRIDENTKIVYNSISDLKENDKVLISIAYGASTKPEVHPMTIALLKHLFSRGIKVYIVSLWPESPIMAEQAISDIKDLKLFDVKDGVDYIMFDYKVGGFAVIKGIADDFREIYRQDYNGNSIEKLEIMEGIYSVKDFDFVFDFSAGVPGNSEWVQYACDPKSVPLSSGCTSVMVTDAIPYVESGQIKGILAGLPGAGEYESMVYDYISYEQKKNNGFCGKLDGFCVKSEFIDSLGNISIDIDLITKEQLNKEWPYNEHNSYQNNVFLTEDSCIDAGYEWVEEEIGDEPSSFLTDTDCYNAGYTWIQKDNKYINKNSDFWKKTKKDQKGKGTIRMDAQNVAHLLMVIFIIIGNIAYYYSRKEN